MPNGVFHRRAIVGIAAIFLDVAVPALAWLHENFRVRGVVVRGLRPPSLEYVLALVVVQRATFFDNAEQLPTIFFVPLASNRSSAAAAPPARTAFAAGLIADRAGQAGHHRLGLHVWRPGHGLYRAALSPHRGGAQRGRDRADRLALARGHRAGGPDIGAAER